MDRADIRKRVDSSDDKANPSSGDSSDDEAYPSSGDALCEAANNGDNDEVLRLLQNGADINARSSYFRSTALIEAASEGHTETVALLLEHGAGVNAKDGYRRTALIAAASEGRTETVALLLEHGAGVNAKDASGRSPLTSAAIRGHTEPVALLLDHKADVNARGEGGDIALIAAALGGHHETVALLLDRGADSNAKNKYGCTSLMSAAGEGYYSVVELLLTHGADKLATDREGKSAKDYALNKNKFICADQITEDKLYSSWVKPLISCGIIRKNENEEDEEDREELLDDVNEVCKLIYKQSEFDKNLFLNWSNMGMHDADLEKKLTMLNGDIQYQMLLIDNNHLTVLPDLSKYPQLQGLQILVAFNNEIHAMRGFSPKLKAIFLRNNDIKVFERKCFHENIFGNLRNQLMKTSIVKNLKKPPKEVLDLGLHAVLDYFTQGHFLLNYHNRMVLIGPSMDGKSSLMESLIAGRPRLVNVADRTKVVDIKKWEVTEYDTIYIYDQGGHDLYQITNPYFISPRSIVLISHKVCCSQPEFSCNITLDHFNQEIKKTMEFLRTTLYQHPENEIYIAVTKTDQLVPSGELLNLEDDRYSLRVRDAVNKEIQKEIDNLNKILRKEDESYSSNVISKRDNFISRLEGIKFFAVSSSTYAGIDNFKKNIHLKIKGESTEIPKAWIDTYHLMKEDKNRFWKYIQFENCFIQQITDGENNCQTCLRYLHETGLVFWNEHHPHLNQYVFHDMDFLVDIFKSLFDHSLSEESFESDENVQGEFDDEEEFKELVSLYKKEGLLKHRFLSFLLNKHKLSHEMEDTIIEIIKLFHICSEIIPNCKDVKDQEYFVPWLVRDNHPPSEVDIHRPLSINRQTITLVMRYKFFNTIPINIAEMFCVEIQKYSVENNYLGRRYAWHDGLQVFLGQAQIILFRMIEDRSLYLCIRGNPGHLSKLWKPFRNLHDACEIILKPWRGVVRSRHSICAHCVLHGINPPHCWMPKQVFPDKPFEPEAMCPKGGGVFPVALITCLPQDGTDVTEQVEAVNTYLMIHCPEKKRLKLITEHQDAVIFPKDDSQGPEKKRLKTLTGHVDDVSPSQDDSQGAQRNLTFSRDIITDMLREPKSEGWIEHFSNMVDYKLTRADLQNIISAMCYSCFLEYPHAGASCTGTGFFLGFLEQHSTGKLLSCIATSYHHKTLWTQGSTGHFVFDKYDAVSGNYTTIAVTLDHVIWCDERLDYAIFAVENNQLWQRFRNKDRPLNSIFMPQSLSDLPKENTILALLGHPEGKPMRVDSLQIVSKEHILKDPNVVKAKMLAKFGLNKSTNLTGLEDEVFLYYHCTSFKGASGAPCYRFAGNRVTLYAMHSGGMHTSTDKAQPGAVSDYEFGVYMCAIIRNIEIKKTNDFSWK